MAKTIELYNILKDKLGDEGSKAIVDALEEVGAKTDDMKYMRLEMATKLDISELKGDLKSLRLEMKIFFIVVIFLMLLANPKAMDLIAKLPGLVK